MQRDARAVPELRDEAPRPARWPGWRRFAAPDLRRIDHVLSTRLLTSNIFADLIARAAAAAPADSMVTRSYRPRRGSDVWHYHRPNLEARLRPRSVATVHHDLDDDRGWLRLKYFLPRYREAFAVHCLNTTQAAILAGHGVGHTRIVPHGVDRGVFPMPTRPRQWPGGRLRLGIVSRWYSGSVKGGWAFDALLAQLDPRRVAFVFVGEGRWRDARAARAKGFAAEHWERLPYPRLAEVYAAIDALLILSRFEGGPASLPEALGSGIPVLCTPVGMCRDLVCDGGNGVLLTGRARTDGERIMALLDGDGRELALLNGNAFASAAEIPAWEEVMAQWHALYAEAAAVPA